MFYTRSNGVRVPATVVGFAPDGLVHLEYFRDAVKMVNRQCAVESISFAIPGADSPPPCSRSPSPPPNDRGRRPSLHFLSVFFFSDSFRPIHPFIYQRGLGFRGYGYQGVTPARHFVVYIALFWTLDNSENTTRLNFGVLNCSCMLLEVAGFQGYYRGKHRNNWRCARAVQKRPLNPAFQCPPPPPPPPVLGGLRPTVSLGGGVAGIQKRGVAPPPRCKGVFVAPACGDTATETLRPRILPKATTLDLHRAQCPRFALTQASGLADNALERGHTICRPSRWTTKRNEGCATSSARRSRRPWERPHNNSQVQRLESETHPHLQRAPAKVQADHKTPPNPRGQQDPRPDHSPQPASQPLV